jgi:hypothetical protein
MGTRREVRRWASVQDRHDLYLPDDCAVRPLPWYSSADGQQDHLGWKRKPAVLGRGCRRVRATAMHKASSSCRRSPRPRNKARVNTSVRTRSDAVACTSHRADRVLDDHFANPPTAVSFKPAVARRSETHDSTRTRFRCPTPRYARNGGRDWVNPVRIAEGRNDKPIDGVIKAATVFEVLGGISIQRKVIVPGTGRPVWAAARRAIPTSFRQHEPTDLSESGP